MAKATILLTAEERSQLQAAIDALNSARDRVVNGTAAYDSLNDAIDKLIDVIDFPN